MWLTNEAHILKQKTFLDHRSFVWKLVRATGQVARWTGIVC